MPFLSISYQFLSDHLHRTIKLLKSLHELNHMTFYLSERLPPHQLHMTPFSSVAISMAGDCE